MSLNIRLVTLLWFRQVKKEKPEVTDMGKKLVNPLPPFPPVSILAVLIGSEKVLLIFGPIDSYQYP